MTNVIGKFIDRYKIIEKIGMGGMSIVYKAYDTRLERDVAVKIIRSDAFPPNQLERILKRFEREAKALGRLSHPNIIKVIDYGSHEGAPFLVMEYLAGGTLKQRLGKPIPWQNAVRLLLPITAALEYAHEQKIIHRDIKPSNILLTPKGQPLLTDFGIAKLLETDETFTLTGTGIGVGTPEYMSPEQWTGSATVQSDIYSLGVVLYEMVTGRKPYTADTPAAILLKQATEPLPRPSKYVSSLPQSIEKILLKALASNLKVRYKDVSDFMGDLDSLIADTGKSGKPVAVPFVNKTVEEDLKTQDTYLQDETYSTKLQTGTYNKSRGKTRTTQTMTMPAVAQKKNSWWPWVAGFAGMACLALVGIMSIGGGLFAMKEGIIAADTPAATKTLVVNNTPVASHTAPATESPILVKISATPIPPTRVVPTSDSSYLLELCDSSLEDICVYSISPQPVGLIISFKFKKDITNSNMPVLTVNGGKFKCEVLAAYPGRLICSGVSTVGDAELILKSSANDKICSGNFIIPKAVEPQPTKKNTGNNGGNSYP